jgi:hypothetical protein
MTLEAKKALAVFGLIFMAGVGPARAQTAPGAPQIYDDKGVLVGAALLGERVGQNFYGRVLMSFPDGVAVVNIDPSGLTPLYGEFPVEPTNNEPEPPSSALELFTAYFTTPDCKGDFLYRVRDFPNYGLFIPTGDATAGYSAAGTVFFPRKPFKTVTLYAKSLDRGCERLTPPLQSALVGGSGQASVPRYKLPFNTK